VSIHYGGYVLTTRLPGVRTPGFHVEVMSATGDAAAAAAAVEVAAESPEVAAKRVQVNQQGELVRQLKANKAPADEIKAAVEALLALKKELAALQAGASAAGGEEDDANKKFELKTPKVRCRSCIMSAWCSLSFRSGHA
jgi:hypothetical protein